MYASYNGNLYQVRRSSDNTYKSITPRSAGRVANAAADMENGLYPGVNAGLNSGDPTVNYRFTTAIIKGGANQWAIRAGNAQSGGLSTYYSGPRPNVSGCNPMHKEGARTRCRRTSPRP